MKTEEDILKAIELTKMGLDIAERCGQRLVPAAAIDVLLWVMDQPSLFEMTLAQCIWKDT